MITQTPGVRLLGLAGPRGCGKTTAALLLQQQHGFVPLAFADPIREAVLELFTGWDRGHFEAALKDAVCPRYGISPRAALRAFGEHTRALAPLAYIEAMARRVESIGLSCGRSGARVVIHDVRLPEEAAWIRSVGGQVVHVLRAGLAWSGEHATERGPGVDAADLRLPNPGTLATYQAMIGALVGVMG